MTKTDTLTDAEVVDALARFMGWRVVHKNGNVFAYTGDAQRVLVLRGPATDSSLEHWDPLNCLNAIREVEERLTEEQRREYLNTLVFGNHDEVVWWYLRHADARTCAMALAEVLGGKDVE